MYVNYKFESSITLLFIFSDDSDHYYESLDTPLKQHQQSNVESQLPLVNYSDTSHYSTNHEGTHDDEYDSFDTEEESDEDIKKVKVNQVH